MTTLRAWARRLPLIAVLAGLTACSGPDAGWQGVTGGARTAVALPVASPSTGAEAPATVTEPLRVDITLTETTIAMPATLSAGPTRLVITNADSVERRFNIAAAGGETTTASLPAGQTGAFVLTLTSGAYLVTSARSSGATVELAVQISVP